MSNKTQLQTNNTTLASLIQTLQGKAAGGSGGAVETCTVEIVVDAPIPGQGSCLFTNANMNIETGVVSMMDIFSGVVAKGTIFLLIDVGETRYDIVGNATVLFGGSDNWTGLSFTTFSISGDCTIRYA